MMTLRIWLLIWILGSTFLPAHSQVYNRGTGSYPGDPLEYFGPGIKLDSLHYRNLALHRAVYQSSAYDYNLTAQLLTDGIIETHLPAWIVTSTSSSGVLPRDGREHILDRHPASVQSVQGSHAWIQIEMAGDYILPRVDSINLNGSLMLDTLLAEPWSIALSGSMDGIHWEQLINRQGKELPGINALNYFRRIFPINLKKMTPAQRGFFRRFAPRKRRYITYSVKLSKPVCFRYYRLNLDDSSVRVWNIGDLDLLYQGREAPIGGPYSFTSAWKAADNGPQWIYVDLGSVCTFNRVNLCWISKARSGTLQVADDTAHWKDLASLPKGPSKEDIIRLKGEARGRYVRVLMDSPVSLKNGFILSEMQVMGRGGPLPLAHRQEPRSRNGQQDLSGGDWRLQRASLVRASGPQISSPGFRDPSWMVATVPATTLVSYLNDGAIPDPNYADNQLMISDSYFYSDFWYRDRFIVPASYRGRRTYLNFSGINWKARVFLNGRYLGKIDGAFIRGRFDVTGILVPGAANVLAVRILRNDTPGFPTEQNRMSTDANGGELGADNPTFHASIGWDWIPTIRGRNTGIWNRVFLSASGAVTLKDPHIVATLPLPDTSTASIRLEVTLRNHGPKRILGTLVGHYGTASFRKPFILGPLQVKTLVLDSSNTPALKLKHPKLWWPNGYGSPNLYRVQLEVLLPDGRISDQLSFHSGIRQLSYSQKGGALRIWVNGRRFIPRGGNWGFSEDLLRYRAREYNIAVRYHRDMNFNMIRDWVGQVDDQAFYRACDRYGILIWQDFWLANPSDGPNPIHPRMFIRNLSDLILRIRNHPSIALFVGRNEGNPPPVLEDTLIKMLPLLDSGIRYIPNSAFGPVSGGGPYGMMPLNFYFQDRATAKLHSEMGMPDIVSEESLRRMMPSRDIWPQSTLWGVHDFTLQRAVNGQSFNRIIREVFGPVPQERKWLSLAAWTEYQGYRAMFEAQSRNRMGLLIWMSHPSWPSLVWQTYDYYFEPTAAYFGAKKACEPLHIQWNPLSDSVEVVNYSIPDGRGLRATFDILNLKGKLMLHKTRNLDCPADSTIRVFAVTKPRGLSEVYFVRLRLSQGGRLISRNLYMRGLSGDSANGIGDLRAINQLPRVRLVQQSREIRIGKNWILHTTLSNPSGTPALIVRLKLVGKQSGKRILPVIYSDNYITVLPGEKRTISLKFAQADTRGETPEVVVEGYNMQ